jgi:hypothetical protein
LSETSVLTRATRRNIPEDAIFDGVQFNICERWLGMSASTYRVTAGRSAKEYEISPVTLTARKLTYSLSDAVELLRGVTPVGAWNSLHRKIVPGWCPIPAALDVAITVRTESKVFSLAAQLHPQYKASYVSRGRGGGTPSLP